MKTTFTHAELGGAKVDGAIVYGADFAHARGLTQAQVDACWQGDREVIAHLVGWKATVAD